MGHLQIIKLQSPSPNLQNMVFINFWTLEFTPPILYNPKIVIPAREKEKITQWEFVLKDFMTTAY